LLFYRGRFTAAAARAEGPPEVVDTLLAWPRHTDWI
jgi:3-hydroxy-9,10-secoandrosta-1,3,5(10)-triene-9,17-dione monooxygenase reductase component